MHTIIQKLCRLCLSPNIKTIINLGETALANSYRNDDTVLVQTFPLEVFLCEDCGSTQLKHTVDPSVLFKHYLYQSSHSQGLVNHFKGYAQNVFDVHQLQANELIVDIGGNCGVLADPFKSLGLRFINVEPASNLAAVSESKGITTINGFFNQLIASLIIEQHGKAKVVTCNNCFAHINDLHEIIKGVDLLLNDDGVFVFENAYWLKSIKGNYIDQIYHEHLFYHTIKPLRSFLMANGFYIYDIQEVDIQGGSFRITCGKKASLENISLINDFVNEEEQAGLYNAAMYENWHQKICNIAANLVTMLRAFKESGSEIAAYGVPAKATTLTKILMLEDIIDYYVDDSVWKIGKSMPGINKKIISSSEWRQKNPKITIILAWNFAEMIMAKHKNYLQNGNNFIVPLPEIIIH